MPGNSRSRGCGATTYASKYGSSRTPRAGPRGTRCHPPPPTPESPRSRPLRHRPRRPAHGTGPRPTRAAPPATARSAAGWPARTRADSGARRAPTPHPHQRPHRPKHSVPAQPARCRTCRQRGPRSWNAGVTWSPAHTDSAAGTALNAADQRGRSRAGRRWTVPRGPYVLIRHRSSQSAAAPGRSGQELPLHPPRARGVPCDPRRRHEATPAPKEDRICPLQQGPRGGFATHPFHPFTLRIFRRGFSHRYRRRLASATPLT